MKKLIIVFSLFFVHSNAQYSPVIPDTLQWLKTKIEQRNNYFHGKPLQVLFDSLYGLKNSIKSNLGIYPKTWRHSDTIYNNHITVYFEDIHDRKRIMNNGFANHYVPLLKIWFINDVPFIYSWNDNDREGLGSHRWNAKLEAYYSPFIVDSVSVGVY